MCVVGIVREVKFYVSVCFNLACCHLTGHRQWYSRIDERLVLGALPLLSHWPALQREESITHVVSMLEPFEQKRFVLGSREARERGVEHLSLPVRDFVGWPTMEQVREGISFIERAQSSSDRGSVYVHCKAGRTRSAFLVVCWLLHSDTMTTVDDAILRVRQHRRHIQFTSQQRDALNLYAKELGAMTVKDICDEKRFSG